jgi:hypothetical protein
MKKDPKVYGLLAEFENPEHLLVAAKQARDAGYARMDAYTPFPVHGLSEAIGFRRSKLALIVLCGGILGAIGGYLLQYWTAAIALPLNIGGRPYNSWPSFIVITFECTILAASGTAVLAMLALNGLPKPYHPLFNVPSFDLATRSHFFLCIESRDEKFDLEKTTEFLRTLHPREITAVPGRSDPAAGDDQ